MEEIEALRWAGQAGAGGAIVYLLIRFGPLLERLLTPRKNGQPLDRPPPARHGENRVRWDDLFMHCERQHKATGEIADGRFAAVEEALKGLRTDLREDIKDLRRRVDRRNNGHD